MPPDTQATSDSDLESIISIKEIKSKSRRNSTGPKYFCSISNCGASFKRLDQLDRHEYHHTGVKKHACSYEGCNKTYSIVTHLKRHLRTTHERIKPAEKNVNCTIENCDKVFYSVCNMQRHIREVHENPKIYKCTYCGEKFTQKLKMRRHEIIKHTGEYPHNCSKCSKGFYQKWQYESHISICKIYPCTDCEETFDKWSLYTKHCKQTLHGRLRYKCEHCPSTYNKPSELKAHVAAKHLTDEQQITYKCTQEGCTRFYIYERNLKQHMLTAHNGRRFACTVENCYRVFRSSQNLTKHNQKGDHTNTNIKKVNKKSKTARKKRKDKGQSLISNLTKLSAIVVDKKLDKLLRAREDDALSAVAEEMIKQTEEDITDIETELN
ncbi:zinc finger protein 117 [Teleopsis dalmanni]|uniref:zinc finger protein 117 n=1 Tax=Teleopsis dalmanni TaxID=139649 RepID=UPI0018CE9487|nr:zinc finger protein 117 [Teleopsis dalmanni]